MQDQHETPTVFRRWPDGTIDAIFPYIPGAGYRVMGYTRVGQHFEADYDCAVGTTKSAKPHEYQSLKTELEGLGYKIKVIKRASRDKMSKARTEMMVNYLSLST